MNAEGSYPHPPKPPRPSGVTNVGSTTAIDTHNLAGTIIPKMVAPPLTPAVYQGPTSRRCGHARRRSTPTPRGDAQTTHTTRAIVLCVPFGDPHVHKVTTSKEAKQECTHSSANTLGTSPPYGEDTPDRRQVQRKEKEGDTSAKGSVLMLTCVPLPHLVLPLSGCACSGTPTKATRGEARGHP